MHWAHGLHRQSAGNYLQQAKSHCQGTPELADSSLVSCCFHRWEHWTHVTDVGESRVFTSSNTTVVVLGSLGCCCRAALTSTCRPEEPWVLLVSRIRSVDPLTDSRTAPGHIWLECVCGWWRRWCSHRNPTEWRWGISCCVHCYHVEPQTVQELTDAIIRYSLNWCEFYACCYHNFLVFKCSPHQGGVFITLSTSNALLNTCWHSSV